MSVGLSSIRSVPKWLCNPFQIAHDLRKDFRTLYTSLSLSDLSKQGCSALMFQFSTSSWRGYTQAGTYGVMEALYFSPAGGSVVKGFMSVNQAHLPVENAPSVLKAVNPGSPIYMAYTNLCLLLKYGNSVHETLLSIWPVVYKGLYNTTVIAISIPRPSIPSASAVTIMVLQGKRKTNEQKR